MVPERAHAPYSVATIQFFWTCIHGVLREELDFLLATSSSPFVGTGPISPGHSALRGTVRLELRLRKEGTSDVNNRKRCCT